MGCTHAKEAAAQGKKTILENGHAGRTSGSSSGNGADEKPWKPSGSGIKRNQVSPLPIPSTVLPASLPTASPDLSASFASVVESQKPECVAADIARLCSQCRSSVLLSELAEQLQAVCASMAQFLRLHSHPVKLAVLRTCAADARSAINSLFSPILAHMDRLLSSRAATSAISAENTSWEEFDFPDLLHCLECGCNAVYNLGVMEVGRPAALLLDILTQIHRHCSDKGMPLDAKDVQVTSLCELMAMVGVVFFRKIVLETSDSTRLKLEDYQQLRDQLGWNDEHLATCLDPRAKAMLVYIEQVSAAGERRMNFTVRRSSVFWDVLASPSAASLQKSTASGVATSVKVFPSFVDEYAPASPGKRMVVEAGEGHGPRKEFFLLAGDCMVTEGADMDGGVQHTTTDRPPLFVYNRAAGAYWYNPQLEDCMHLRAAFITAGWLMGQCVLNRAPLGLVLPHILFRQLLEGRSFTPDLADLEHYDPEAAKSIRNVLALPINQMRDFFETEGLPRNTSPDVYVAQCVRTLLVTCVEWQVQSLETGFWQTLDRRLLRTWQLGPAELACLVSGEGQVDGADELSAGVDIRKVFRVVLDEELSGRSAVLGELLWEVLASWVPEMQLRFVEFVTGTPRLPLPGSELMKIQVPFVAMGLQEHSHMLGMLPQAHTCDNLLELPNYWESLLVTKGYLKPGALTAPSLTEAQVSELRAQCAATLSDRLHLAVDNFSGYGLDERERGDEEDREDANGNSPLATPMPTYSGLPLTAHSLASLSQHSSMIQGPVFEAVARVSDGKTPQEMALSISRLLSSTADGTGTSRQRPFHSPVAQPYVLRPSAVGGLVAKGLQATTQETSSTMLHFVDSPSQLRTLNLSPFVPGSKPHLEQRSQSRCCQQQTQPSQANAGAPQGAGVATGRMAGGSRVSSNGSSCEWVPPLDLDLAPTLHAGLNFLITPRNAQHIARREHQRMQQALDSMTEATDVQVAHVRAAKFRPVSFPGRPPLPAPLHAPCPKQHLSAGVVGVSLRPQGSCRRQGAAACAGGGASTASSASSASLECEQLMSSRSSGDLDNGPGAGARGESFSSSPSCAKDVLTRRAHVTESSSMDARALAWASEAALVHDAHAQLASVPRHAPTSRRLSLRMPPAQAEEHVLECGESVHSGDGRG